jgi:subtilisin family serine protease
MMWYFERNHEQSQASQNGAEPAAGTGGVGGLPASVLARHGARVLDPATAAVIGGQQPLRPTVYRASTLLVPGSLLSEPGLTAINQALAPVGMKLSAPGRHRPGSADDRDRPGQRDRDRPGQRIPDPAADGELGDLPRVGVLGPADAQPGRAAVPVVVDAWVALQALRAAAIGRVDKALHDALVSRISLEHLLFGSAITGSPISEGGGVTGSPISEGGGVTGPGAASSYLFPGGDARAPVGIFMPAAHRRDAKQCASEFGRRPVVAVLDTGVRTHPWLGVEADPATPGHYRTVSEAFVAVSQDLQDAIFSHAQQAAAAGDQLRQLIRYPWDRPVTPDPEVGELDTHTGHGAFIAGIVRQVAPDAEVLSVRIMHSDGIVYEGDLTCALAQLASRVQTALAGDLAEMVDVVCLSLGYFSESAADVAYSSGLQQVIAALTGMGVTVIAAAGNYATSRKFYPAAFAAGPAAPGHAPVISVGALNPNGSKALFSDGGPWVRAWATGAAVISTFPTDINGSRDPDVSLRAHPANTLPARPGPAERASLDPDDYSGGFATWSGTSFSAPQVAGQLALELMRGAAADPALQLDRPGAAEAGQRTGAALLRMGWS